MKELRIIALTLAIMLACSLACFAVESDTTSVAPRYNTVCGNLAYHNMVRLGTGRVLLRDGSTYISGGTSWQCSNCLLPMVTEGYLSNGSMTQIGRWATDNCRAGVITNTSLLISPPVHYDVCYSTSMDGYRFVNN